MKWFEKLWRLIQPKRFMCSTCLGGGCVECDYRGDTNASGGSVTAEEINVLTKRASMDFPAGSVTVEQAASALQRFGEAAAKVPDSLELRRAVLRAEYGWFRFVLPEYWRLAHNTGTDQPR